MTYQSIVQHGKSAKISSKVSKIKFGNLIFEFKNEMTKIVNQTK